ncbi:MAG: hypothetical protein ABIF17_03870 [Patescibacteria group bacterium]
MENQGPNQTKKSRAFNTLVKISPEKQQMEESEEKNLELKKEFDIKMTGLENIVKEMVEKPDESLELENAKSFLDNYNQLKADEFLIFYKKQIFPDDVKKFQKLYRLRKEIEEFVKNKGKEELKFSNLDEENFGKFYKDFLPEKQAA